jgi:ankyrin repeat protein
MLASKDSREAVAYALLSAGADVNVRSTNNVTAMTMASKNGHQRMIKLLKEAGAKE